MGVWFKTILRPYNLVVWLVCLLSLIILRGSFNSEIARWAITGLIIITAVSSVFSDDFIVTISTYFLWLNTVFLWNQLWIVSPFVVAMITFIIFSLLIIFSFKLNFYKSIAISLIVAELTSISLYWPISSLSKALIACELFIIIDALVAKKEQPKPFYVYTISVILIGVIVIWVEFFK